MLAVRQAVPMGPRWRDDRDRGERAGARVKDISSIEGIRDNQLVGYGLVVGLQGTGDSQQTTFPTQTLAAMLLRMGVSVPASAIRVQNLAAVFVSATLPPFARPGTKLDITASFGGRCAVAGRRAAADDAAVWDGREDLRAGAGAAGGGRILGEREWEYEAVQPSDDGADSVWRDGGARGAAGDWRDGRSSRCC